MSSDDELPPPKAKWLNTEEVIEKYQFDPRRYEMELKSKLAVLPACDMQETHSFRVWDETSVKYHKAAKPKEA